MNDKINLKSLAIITTTEMTVTSFLLNHIIELEKFYDVTVITKTENVLFLNEYGFRGKVIPIPISREINIVKDIYTLYKLTKLFIIYSFDNIISVTPKAGLLSMVAGLISRTPNRIHFFTGQVWATRTGFSRYLLKFLDKVTFFCSTEVLVDSFSQRDFLLKEKVITEERSSVLADGSVGGVNLQKYARNEGSRSMLRKKWNLVDADIVLLFLGRVCYEKGINELLCAFAAISKSFDNAHLVIVGPNEGEYGPDFFHKYNHLNVIVEGSTANPEIYYSAADIFVLPSHREGFGTVVLEAAAAKIPSVGSSIYGLSDAIIDGETGLLHLPKDPLSLEKKIIILLKDADLRRRLGEAAFNRVQDKFSEEVLIDALLKYFQSQLVKSS